MNDNNDTDLLVDDLEALKAQADRLGVKYHPSISAEKLSEKLKAALETQPEEKVAPAAAETKPKETEDQRRLRLKREAEKLVRIRVTCMNPNKKAFEGEVFTVGNSVVGTFRKYVPFDAPDGWHVPNIIYEMLKERQCQIFVETRDERGNRGKKGKLIKEFAIEVLPSLSEKELKELARRQAMRKSVD